MSVIRFSQDSDGDEIISAAGIWGLFFIICFFMMMKHHAFLETFVSIELSFLLYIHLWVAFVHCPIHQFISKKYQEDDHVYRVIMNVTRAYTCFVTLFSIYAMAAITHAYSVPSMYRGYVYGYKLPDTFGLLMEMSIWFTGLLTFIMLMIPMGICHMLLLSKQANLSDTPESNPV